ncbi:DUF3141 domain-containing protein [Cupriavidus basilensis]
MPPVLVFDHETLADARTLPEPVNYALLRIIPPADMPTDPAKRPFVVIDPRAGHGPGIGELQGRQRDRHRTAHRAPVLLHHVLPRSVSGPDDRVRRAGRGRLPADHRRTPP